MTALHSEEPEQQPDPENVNQKECVQHPDVVARFDRVADATGHDPECGQRAECASRHGPPLAERPAHRGQADRKGGEHGQRDRPSPPVATAPQAEAAEFLYDVEPPRFPRLLRRDGALAHVRPPPGGVTSAPTTVAAPTP